MRTPDFWNCPTITCISPAPRSGSESGTTRSSPSNPAATGSDPARRANCSSAALHYGGRLVRLQSRPQPRQPVRTPAKIRSSGLERLKTLRPGPRAGGALRFLPLRSGRRPPSPFGLLRQPRKPPHCSRRRTATVASCRFNSAWGRTLANSYRMTLLDSRCPAGTIPFRPPCGIRWRDAPTARNRRSFPGAPLRRSLYRRTWQGASPALGRRDRSGVRAENPDSQHYRTTRTERSE